MSSPDSASVGGATTDLVFASAKALDDALGCHLLAYRTSVALVGRCDVWEAFASDDGDVYARQVVDHVPPDVPEVTQELVTIPVHRIPEEEFPVTVCLGSGPAAPITCRRAFDTPADLVASARDSLLDVIVPPIMEHVPAHISAAARQHIAYEDLLKGADAAGEAIIDALAVNAVRDRLSEVSDR